MQLTEALVMFLTAREAEGRASRTLIFYRERIAHLLAAFNTVEEITPDKLRRFILDYKASHTAGGANALYRSVKALFNWIEAEEALRDWSNPIHKVHPLKVDRQPVKRVTIPELSAMLGVSNRRDAVILLTLFDTCTRASQHSLIDLDMGCFLV